MNEAHGDLDYDTSVLIHTQDLPWEKIYLEGLKKPLEGKILRVAEKGFPRSAILKIPKGWHLEPSLVSATQQLFVLSGCLRVEQEKLQAFGFLVVESKAILPKLHAEETTEVISILDGEQRLRQSSQDPKSNPARIIADARTIKPIVPVIDGREMTGFARRVLWYDVANKADTRLLTIPAGFEGGGPSWHPVHEEIFCLEGDVAPDDRRPLTAGSFLWNPANSVHGFHEHSIHGCMLLEWHDGEWAYMPYEDSASGISKP